MLDRSNIFGSMVILMLVVKGSTLELKINSMDKLSILTLKAIDSLIITPTVTGL